MIIRPFEKRDAVWLKPIAAKYNVADDLRRITEDPDEAGVVICMVVAPYCAGLICLDEHGALLEGVTDTYGIKHFVRGAELLCKLADDAGIDLHNHKGQKPWERWILKRLGFSEDVERGWIRYAYNTEKEVA